RRVAPATSLPSGATTRPDPELSSQRPAGWDRLSRIDWPSLDVRRVRLQSEILTLPAKAGSHGRLREAVKPLPQAPSREPARSIADPHRIRREPIAAGDRELERPRVRRPPPAS